MPISKFYFSANQDAGASPAFGAWDGVSVATRHKLLSSKESGEVITAGATCTPGPAQTELDRQYVSGPLAAQTISGSVLMQLQARQVGPVGKATSALLIKVVSGDGGTERGVLLALAQHGVASELRRATFQNKTFADSEELAELEIEDGDRLVVEIGLLETTNLGGQPICQMRYGAPDSGTDLPEDETTTTALVPWIEFSTPILMS